VKRTTNGYVARCPAHEDTEQGLSVAAGDDGRVLLKCFAGCTAAELVTSLGLTWADLSRSVPRIECDVLPGRGKPPTTT